MASDQETVCAVCLERKHTPLRRDEMGGYVCLTCIERQLDALQAAAAIPPSGEAVAWLNPHNGAIAGQRTRNNTVPLYAAPPAPIAIDEAIEIINELAKSLKACRSWMGPSETGVRSDMALGKARLFLAALNPQPNGDSNGQA